ncbi:MAG: signal peptidase I, partial [Bacteroidota bacterium]
MSERSFSVIAKLREWSHAIAFAVVMATLVRWLLLEAFIIPSSSMERTLLAGDYVLVSKLHYGTRTPITPLQIPLTHQTIGGTNIPAYLDWIQLSCCRLPGYSRVKRGDQVVFNYPIELDRPTDLRTYYIKRCVGLPGDTLCIQDARIYIDKEPQPQYPGLQHRYYLRTAAALSDRFFKEAAIREYMSIKGGYLVHTTAAIITQLASHSTIKAVKCLVLPPGVEDPEVYASSGTFPWNGDQWG